MPELVVLDRDHPGFRDLAYRQRRNEIASLALQYQPGTPIPNAAYTEEERGVWATALEHLVPLHQTRACPAYLAAYPRLGLSPASIPSFEEVNARLGPLTGFRLEPVAGLVSPRQFMERLADRVFLATQYVRHHSSPLYTPEPDVIHELVGHGPLLADPDFAEVNRLFGEVTLGADDELVQKLIRLYWYALEFGVYGEPGSHRVVGAGLLSSYGELGRFAQSADLRRFDVDAITDTPFDPTDYQGILFVAESSERILSELRAFLTGAKR